MSISADQIHRWAQPPSETENERSLNAKRQVMDVLREHYGDSIELIPQGSHHNRTNVKHDSDVDMAVVYTDSYFPDISRLSTTDKELYETYRTPATYKYPEFKTDVYNLLRREFGSLAVERRDKCIRVEGNSTRVNADVVPAFENRRYSAYDVVAATGISILTDKGKRVNSFPVQHYESGIAKNESTRKAFKATVRILKHTRNDLNDRGLLHGGDVASFLIECLVWNVPDEFFTGKTHREDALGVAAKIWNDMRDATIANRYMEVCKLRSLFGDNLHHTRERAEDFALQVWQHIS